MRTRSSALAAVLAILLLAGLLAAPAQAYEHRRGTPSIGVQLHYGLLAGNADWTDVFSTAHGVTIHVRQYIARNRALGLTFELQRYAEGTTVPLIAEEFNPDYLQIQLIMFDYYFYFNRAQKRTPYLVLSGGFYRPEIVDEGDRDLQQYGSVVEHPDEGLIARTGVGLEWFLGRTFSIDGSISGYYIHGPSSLKGLIEDPDSGGLAASFMAALGVHLYTGK